MISKLLLIQDVITLINRKTQSLNYSSKYVNSKSFEIVINYDELVLCPSKEIIIDSLKEFSNTEQKWISFKNNNESIYKLFNVIDLIVFSNDHFKFYISYFYLKKLKRAEYNYENFKKIVY